MTDAMEKTAKEYRLPASVVTRRDLSRLLTDAERVDNELTSRSVREKAGADSGEAPIMSDQLREFLEQNQCLFEQSRDRSALISELKKLKSSAPVIHMTFAVEADPESLSQLVGWLRESVSPQALIDVGLQPGLIGGVHLRTTNRIHDLSLRGALSGGHDLLTKELESLRVSS